MAAPMLPSVAPLTPRFVRRYRDFDHWTCASRSKPDQEPHTITVNRDGVIHCSCANHTLGAKRCAHIEAVEAAMKETAMGFNPGDHLINMERDPKKPKRLYLEVKWRLVWFRQDHPTATIETEIISIDPEQQWAVIKATIRTQDGGLATGMVLQKPTGIAADYVANGETSAIGRALAALGYGTQFATELDQGDAVADAPVQAAPRQQPTPSELSGRPEPPADDLKAARTRLYAAVKAIPLDAADASRLIRHRTGKENSAHLTVAEALDLAGILEQVKRGDVDLSFGTDGTPILASIDGPVGVVS